MSEVLEEIKSRGYWRVAIHPGTFTEKRVANISDLYPILQKTSVQLRGWGFPHLDSKENVQIDSDWIGQESKWHQYLEFWRFYQSGQFIVFLGFDEDWRDNSEVWPAPKGWEPGLTLSAENTIFQLAEIFEFAARLALTEAGDELMHVEILVNGLGGRALRVNPEKRMSLPLKMKASIKELPYKVDVSRTQLITEPRDLALKPALELFRHFGWDPSLEILRDVQGELFRRGSQVVG